MANIIFTQEMGSGYGHITRQLPIAIKLRDQGYKVLFVINNISTVANILSKHNFKYIQFPNITDSNILFIPIET